MTYKPTLSVKSRNLGRKAKRLQPTNDLHYLHFSRILEHSERFADTKELTEWAERARSSQSEQAAEGLWAIVNRRGLDLYGERKEIVARLERGWDWLERNAARSGDERYTERETAWLGLLARYEAVTAALELSAPDRKP